MKFAIIIGNELVHKIYAECITAIKRECEASGHTLDLHYLASVDFHSIRHLDCWILLNLGEFDERALVSPRPFTVFYQGEPATRPHFEHQSVPWIRYADVTFEMCGHSYERTSAENKPVKKIYIGYDPAFCLSDETFEYEYDVGLVGHRSSRRNFVIDKLESAGYRVWDMRPLSMGLWGYERWAKIKKTKIMLEIAWADDFVYGPLRMEGIFLSNSTFIISEAVPPDAHCLARPGTDFVESPYNYMVTSAIQWLPQDEKRQAIANAATEHLKSQGTFGRRFVDTLEDSIRNA